MAQPETMWIFTEEPAAPPPGERPLEPRFDLGRVKRVEVPFDSLQTNMRSFLEGTHRLLEQKIARAGHFAMDTVEVAAQFSADGKVGFLGTGAGIAGQASVKFVFKRRPGDAGVGN